MHPDVDGGGGWQGAAGLAEDIRRYGKWMRDDAEARIGHLYPKIRVIKAMAAERDDLRPYTGKDLTVIAWLWARTVASPDPMMRGAHVPLVSSFVLSSKKGKPVMVVPIIDHGSRTYRFSVKTSGIGPDAYARARKGTKAGRGSNFVCLVSGAPISGDHIKAEGMAGRMGAQLMASVTEGQRTRIYLNPSEAMERIARQAEPEWRPAVAISGSNQYLGIRPYGMDRFDQLFTDRQLVALTTFSDLVEEARRRVLADALVAGMDREAPRLADGGTGAEAYADAVVTYLGLATGKAADYWSGICSWHSSGRRSGTPFLAKPFPMVWDYAETNPFSHSTGNWVACVDWVREGRCLFAYGIPKRGRDPTGCSRTHTSSEWGCSGN